MRLRLMFLVEQIVKIHPSNFLLFYATILIKMCRKTPSLQGWGYKARPPNLRK